MVDPRTMCRRRLLSEHVEIHMLAGSIIRGRGIAGFLRDKILEPRSMTRRHAALAREMVRRSYRHASPLPVLPAASRMLGAVDRVTAEIELRRRCPECKKLKYKRLKGAPQDDRQ